MSLHEFTKKSDFSLNNPATLEFVYNLLVRKMKSSGDNHIVHVNHLEIFHETMESED